MALRINGEGLQLAQAVPGVRAAKLRRGTVEEHEPFHDQTELEVEDVQLVLSRETWLCWSLTVAALVAAWWSAALTIALVLKRTVGSPHGGRHAPGPFPYPLAMTFFVNALTAPSALLLSCATERHKPPPPEMSRGELLKLLLIGILQGMELGLNNKATEFLPVSMKTMMHSMFVLFVMVTARLYGIEALGCLRAFAASLILCGGLFQGWSAERRHATQSAETQHLHGALLMLVAMILGAQRWALVQVVVHSSSASALGQLTKLQFSARTLPTAGFVCLLGALVFEWEAFNNDALGQEELRWAIPLVGASVIVLTLSELSVVRRTSAVALQVLATLHQIPIVVVSAVIFQEHVSALSVLGFSFCIAAAFVYAAARRREKLALAAAGSKGSPVALDGAPDGRAAAAAEEGAPARGGALIGAGGAVTIGAPEAMLRNGSEPRLPVGV